MVCPNCGSVIDDNAKFCDECGTKLEMVQQPNIVQPMESQVNYYSQNTNSNMNYASNSVGNGNVPSNEAKTLGIVALVCGIISILTCGSFIVPEIVAIVCGVLSKTPQGKMTTQGKIGFICGIVSITLVVVILGLGFVMGMVS